MIHEQIKTELKDAMKARDAARLSAVRNILSALTNEAVSLGKKPDEMLDDESAISVLGRLAKQRKDSIAQFREGGREEQAQEEEQELSFIEQFLPEQLSEEEIVKIAQQKKEELGVNEKSEIGKLMGAVMQEVKGRADGNAVKDVVGKLLD